MSDEELSRQIGDLVYRELGIWQNGTARSLQTHIGMSGLGGCREYIRRVASGDPTNTDPLKWAAFVGTAVGDLVETALKDRLGAVTQHRVTVTLPSGIQVSGSTDAVILDKRLLDFKTVNGLDDVMKDGPSEQQKVQVSGYLVGLQQAGTLPADATAHLVFLDRSGKQPHPFVWSETAQEAAGWLEWADDRLGDVAKALAVQDSQGYLRDKPESWCWYTGCPFYNECWAGYQPEGEITEPALIDAMRKYDEGRALAQRARKMQDEAKRILGGFEPAEPVTGESQEYLLSWTLYESRQGVVNRRIDLRKKRVT